jgi:hypothetical protein
MPTHRHEFSALGCAGAIAVFLNVVFDQGASRPAVDKDEDSAGGGCSGAAEVNVPSWKLCISELFKMK